MRPQDNLLLAGLPEPEGERLLAQCEPVLLRLSQVLATAGMATQHVYFPATSFVSLLTELDAQHGLEVGMTGREGMLGVQVVLGQPQEPLRALVQGAGLAWRLDAHLLTQAMAERPGVRHHLLRYVAVLMDQRAASAACLRFHEIGPRLARWLLMSQDRAHTDTFPVTQQFLAAMLGVRRVGVTAAASQLQRSGLIRYHRGQLTVLQRSGLEAASCSCYAADRRLYQRQMGVGLGDASHTHHLRDAVPQ